MTDEKKDAIEVAAAVVKGEQGLAVVPPPTLPIPFELSESTKKTMAIYQEAIPPDKYIDIINKGDYNNLQPSEVAKFLFIHSVMKGLDPWRRPFIFIVNDNKRTLYATKEAAWQIKNRDGLRLKKVYAGHLRCEFAHQVLTDEKGNQRIELVPVRFDPSIYECEWWVLDKEKNVIGIDIGTGDIASVSGRERKDEIMKVYTRGRRRALLEAAGISENDESEAREAYDDPMPQSRKQAASGPQRKIPKPEPPAVLPVAGEGEAAPPSDNVLPFDPDDPTVSVDPKNDPPTTPAPPSPTKRPSKPPILAKA